MIQHRSKTCDVCDGKMKITKTGSNCKICGKNICERCRMAKFIYPTRNTGNFPCSYPFCKPCLSEAKDRLFGKLASRVSFHSSAGSSNSASPRGYRTMPRPGASMMSSSSSGSEQMYSMRGGYDHRVRTSSQDVPLHGVRLLSPRSSGASSMSARGTNSSDSSTYGRSIHQTSSFRGPSADRQGSDAFNSHSARGNPPQARPAGRSIDGHIPGPPTISRNTSDPRRGSNAATYATHPSYARAPTSISSSTTQSSSSRSGLGNNSMSSGYTTSAGTLSFDSVYDMDGGDMYRSVGRAGTSNGVGNSTAGGGYTSEESSDYSDVEEEISTSAARRPMNIYESAADIDDVDDGVIDLTRHREPEPEHPVDVFESDGLKYINTFRANDSAPAAAPSGGNSADDLMERLMQINMAAEATYLMAKYNANIQENLQR